MDLITYLVITFVLQARPELAGTLVTGAATAVTRPSFTVSQAQSNGVSPAPLRRTKGVLKKLIDRQP